METKELAKQLGISIQMTNRYKARGMPVNTLEAAIAWYKKNTDPFRTKTGRICGNSGLKRGAVEKKEIPTDTIIRNAITEALTNVMPHLWFGQIGWIGSALRDHSVKVTAEQLINIQAMLYIIYMSEVDEYLEAESTFNTPEALLARPGDPTYFSLIEQLNAMLTKEPKQLFEA